MKNKIILTVLFLLLFQVSHQIEAAEERAFQGWRIIESKSCTIFCHPEAELKKINRRIKTSFLGFNCGPFSSANNALEEKLAKKFDCIFQKVEKILDMYPRKLHLKVKIYKNQTQLDDAFLQTLGQANTKRLISFYIHKSATIFTTEQVVRRGIIAHEMAHAITDHYFLIPPPKTVKEVLAQYVEIHLED